MSDHSAVLLYDVAFISSLRTVALLPRQPAPAGTSQDTFRPQGHDQSDTLWLVRMFRILERLIN